METGITVKGAMLNTRDQLIRAFQSWGFWDLKPPTKHPLILAFPASMWDINGFRSVRVSKSEHKSTYGKPLYLVEFLA